MESHWRPVPGMEEFEVSSLGCLRRNGRPRRPYLTVGYPSFSQANGGARRFQYVHRAVTLAFHGDPPFEGAEAAHGDGSKTGNCIENLRWATSKENTDDMRRHGTFQEGEASSLAKLTEADVLEIRARYEQEGPTALGREFGMSPQALCDLAKRRTWKHV